MDEIFNFEKTYAGSIKFNGEELSCNLEFPNSNIIFTILIPESFEFNNYTEFSGYITTEKGIKNFRAVKTFQVLNSTTWSKFSKQQFQANGLIITHEKNNVFQEKFFHKNIFFNHLEFIGKFLDIDDTNKIEAFQITPCFERIKFLKNNNECLSLENPFKRSLKRNSKIILTISIEPYLSHESEISLEINEIYTKASKIGWFLQLIFGIKQSIIDLELFDSQINNIKEGMPFPTPFYFYNKSMISNKKRGNDGSNHSYFNIEEVKDELEYSYNFWNNFNENQVMICRLFFNEINSKEYIADDRFKNLCAIIQGLDAFHHRKNTSKEIKGEMNKKIKLTLDSTLEEILFKKFSSQFLYKLFIIIGVQRDHYQHLSKKLTYNLNKNIEDLNAINQFIAVLIKYHLLIAIKFPTVKIIKIVNRDLSFCERRIKFLESTEFKSLMNS